ncbi:DUF1295 domain-containing protein [bacterium]|nr:DUF1295 domain-containing protein [bacterium]
MAISFFYAALFSFAFMSFFWLLYVVGKNPAIVDFAWTLCIGGISIIYFAFGENFFASYLILILMMVWAMRLAFLVGYRLIRDKGDGRYDDLSKKWGTNLLSKYYKFFLMQGLAAFLMTLPNWFISQKGEWTSFDLIGMTLMVIGLVGVIYSDYTLQMFIRDPSNKGEVCERGLWRYSRHPNYFFEWIFWLGLFLVALFIPWGWVSVISPLLLIWTLFYATGIPPLEKRALSTKGDKYKDYQKRVSVFVPWVRGK